MMKKTLTQAIVLQPTAHDGIQKGINQIVDAIVPTLGPQRRFVAIESVIRNKPPELLDNGGLIARRIIELPDRDADMGAMFVRGFLCHLNDTAGDGTATAAVLFQSIYNQGMTYLASGGNAMRLRQFLEKGLEIVLETLAVMTVPLQGQTAISELALTLCDHPALATMLGEIFDIIGEYGQLDIRVGTGRHMEREYVDGMYWSGGSISRALLTDQRQVKTCLDNAALVISDLAVEDPYDLIPLLEMARRDGLSSLIIVLNKLSEKGLSLLLANQKTSSVRVMAVSLPGANEAEQIAALDDLAVLTGAQPLLKAAGDTFRGVRSEHLGGARQAWVTRDAFGVTGGRGNPRKVGSHINTLRSAYRQAADRSQKQALQQRIGKLLGGSATLWIGGANQLETESTKLVAQRTADALRGGLREGILTGGGTAFLACQPILKERLKHASDQDERAAYRLLIAALEVPICTIVANAGYDSRTVLAEVRQCGPGYGFDARSGQVVDMTQAGILDIASVCKAAVQGAVSQAALALTIDVLVHSKNRKVNLTAP